MTVPEGLLRRLLIGVAAVLTFALLLLAGLRLFSARESRLTGELQNWADRELLLPDDRYRFSSVEEELLRPEPYLYVDPEEPFDAEIGESIMADLPEAIRESFTARVEERLEELLFDD